MPRLSDSIPVCQIGVTTVLPGSRGHVVFDGLDATPVNIFLRMSDMMTSLNKQLMKKPLPGESHTDISVEI